MEENKKYEILEDKFIIYKGRKLYRIKALKSISNVMCTIPKGSIGGYVEGYHNLSQKGSCWVFDNTVVYGNAEVSKSSAILYGAEVYGNARVKDSIIKNSSKVFGNAVVKDNSEINEGSIVCENAVVKDSCITNSTHVSNNASVISKGGITLKDSSVSGNSTVTISPGASTEFRQLIATNNSKIEILREDSIIPDICDTVYNLTLKKNEMYSFIKV
jgi:carbonic anhydrase/acetyltransferase-like protein (isoleucine patch superfamily)